MTERRFTDEEVAEIFARATEVQQSVSTKVGTAGLTLAELQDIGREVGIAPDLVVKAARSLDQRVESSSRRFLGLPIGVAETAHLNRTVSDAEWERVVSDLRMTFNATGRTRQDGAFRQWSNGNLRAMLEPAEGGHRLRIQTMKGNARAYMLGGLGLGGLAGALWVASFLGASGNVQPSEIMKLGLIGLAAFAIGAGQLPSWARRRRQQMQALIAKLVSRGGVSQAGEA